MAVGDILQAVIEQELHGQTVLNVCHFRADDAQAGADDLNLQVRTIIVPAMKLVQSVELGHVAVWTQRIWPLPPLVAIRHVGAAGTGAVAGDSLPTSVALVVTKRTDFAGRAFRGRNYIAGVPVTHEADSALAGANQAAWQTMANSFAFAAWAATNWLPVVWHRTDKSSTTITTTEIRVIMRNQRRRQLGVGI